MALYPDSMYDFPNVSAYDSDLREVLAILRGLTREMRDFTVVNKITNAGAWDITKQYKPWTIVSDNNIGYISVRPVPAGIEITNTDYWALVADYDILITNLSERISALETRLKEFAYIPEDFGAKGDGITDDSAAIQAAITNAIADGVGIVAFNHKTYKVNSQIRVDVGKISLYGAGSVLDMSEASGGIVLYNSNNTPYRTANKYIEGLEFIGNENIDCFTTEGAAERDAVSHFKIINCNVHDFRYGFYGVNYVYLIFFMNTDFYECDTCVKLDNGIDSGENISIIGCCLYNSRCGIYNASGNGAIHVTNSSLDYNTITIESTTENRNYFVNSHIEGPGVIKGWANFEDCWIILRDAIAWFDISNGAIQRFTRCFIHTANTYNDAVTGNGHIYFTECEDNNISDLATCDFKGLANVNAPKPGIVWGVGTAAGTTPWNATNAAVSKDTAEHETGTYSIKLEKIYGAGSASSLRLLIPRNPKSTHYQIKLRLKTSTPMSLEIASYLTEMPALNESDGSPYQVADRHDPRNLSVATTGDWETIAIYGNTRFISNDNAHYLVLNLFYAAASSLWLDRIEVIDF